MFSKLLAITALLGSTEAQRGNLKRDFNDKEIEGLKIAKGFFEGSKTVTSRPQDHDKMHDCL